MLDPKQWSIELSRIMDKVWKIETALLSNGQIQACDITRSLKADIARLRDWNSQPEHIVSP